jgi:hypothetical protein
MRCKSSIQENNDQEEEIDPIERTGGIITCGA